MKFPKEMKRFCKKCVVHTTHNVKIEKNRGKNKTHSMTKFSKVRLKLKGLSTGFGNKGKLARGAINSWKRFNKKHSKKTDLRFTCSQCKKSSTNVGGNVRIKKVSIE